MALNQILNVTDEIIDGQPKYNITNNADGTKSIELANEVVAEGTLLNRYLFNKIENILSYLEPSVTQIVVGEVGWNDIFSQELIFENSWRPSQTTAEDVYDNTYGYNFFRFKIKYSVSSASTQGELYIKLTYEDGTEQTQLLVQATSKTQQTSIITVEPTTFSNITKYTFISHNTNTQYYPNWNISATGARTLKDGYYKNLFTVSNNENQTIIGYEEPEQFTINNYVPQTITTELGSGKTINKIEALYNPIITADTATKLTINFSRNITLGNQNELYFRSEITSISYSASDLLYDLQKMNDSSSYMVYYNNSNIGAFNYTYEFSNLKIGTIKILDNFDTSTDSVTIEKSLDGITWEEIPATINRMVFTSVNFENTKYLRVNLNGTGYHYIYSMYFETLTKTIIKPIYSPFNINNQIILLNTTNISTAGVKENSINNVEIDTILQNNKFYEIIYNKETNKFIAQEVRN